MPQRAPGGHIRRADLLDERTPWRQAKVIVICAPAGFGKTVLMSQIRDSLEPQTNLSVWVALSEDDHGAEPFLARISQSLHANQRTPAIGGPLRVSGVPAVQRRAWLLEGLARELESFDGQVWVFIDDLQHVTDEGARETLRKLIAASGESVHFVIASRTPVDLGFAYLRAEGRLVEVSSRELNFSRAQVREVFESKLTEAEIDQILRDTGGWPVAVRLVKSYLAAPGAAYGALLAEGRPRRELFRYLSEHVLAGLAPEVQEFLLITATPDRVCAELAAAMLGGGEAQQTLEQLCRMQLPIESELEQAGWFRYHPLLAEFLRATGAERMPARQRAAHAAAARWFAEQEQWTEALHHARCAGQSTGVLAAMERAGGVRIGTSRGLKALRGLEQCEASVMIDFPACRLGQIYLWIHAGQIAGARAALEDLRKRVRWDTEEQAGHALSLEFLVVDILIASYEERLLSNEELQHFESRLQAVGPRDRPLAAAAAGVIALYYFRSFQFDKCRAVLGRAIIAYHGVKSPYSEVFRYVYAILIELEQGRLAEAQGIVEVLAEHVRTKLDTGEALCGVLHLMRAAIAYESGDIGAAAEHLEDGRAGFGFIQGWTDAEARILRVASLILLRTAGLERALTLIDEAEARIVAMGQRLAAVMCALHRAETLLRAGESAAARAQLAAHEVRAVLARRLDPMHSETFTRVCAGELLAELELLEGHPGRACEELRTLVAFARDAAWSSALARLSLLYAAALEQSGSTEEAAAQATAGLQLARKAGLRSSLTDRLAAIESPLERLRAQGALALDPVTAAYWQALVSERTEPAPAPTSMDRLRGRLSARQMQVLELLGRGMSSKEIANRLGLGVGTVKAHRVVLYRKLGVSLRSGAVAALQETVKPGEK